MSTYNCGFNGIYTFTKNVYYKYVQGNCVYENHRLRNVCNESC